VVGAGSSQTKPPSTLLEQDMPPGRLAARRIVYEISMRTDRQETRARKEVIRSQEASEKDWLDKVNLVAQKDPETVSVKELKTVLVILLGYLALAPNDECQQFIQEKIIAVRKALEDGSNRDPLALARGP
jgi:hypothetical protein